MLTKLAPKNTDKTRRAAIELAVQLPEDVAEARAVLAQAGALLEGFLIRAPREIWNSAAEGRDDRGSLTAHEYALAWTIAGVAVISLVATALAYALDCEIVSGFVLLGGVAVSALVFGQIYGVIFSVLAVVSHNFFVIPPAYAFNAPTRAELVRAVGFVVLAVALPLIANGAQKLRRLAINGALPLSAAARQSASPVLPEAPSVCPDR